MSVEMPEIVFPDDLLAACDDVIEVVHFGAVASNSLDLLEKWLEGDDEGHKLAVLWDDSMALDISLAPYSDNDMRLMGFSKFRKINNTQRIDFAKRWLSEIVEENDSHYLPAILHCEIQGKNGYTAIIGCTIKSYGQGGNVIEWHGAFKDVDAYLIHLSNNGFDVDCDPDKIDRGYISKYWTLDAFKSDCPD